LTPEATKPPTQRDLRAASAFRSLVGRFCELLPTFEKTVMPRLPYVLSTITLPNERRGFLEHFRQIEGACAHVVSAMEALGWDERTAQGRPRAR
jgi:hypothetical protein